MRGHAKLDGAAAPAPEVSAPAPAPTPAPEASAAATPVAAPAAAAPVAAAAPPTPTPPPPPVEVGAAPDDIYAKMYEVLKRRYEAGHISKEIYLEMLDKVMKEEVLGA